MVRVYRREVDAKGAAKAGWEELGTSCLGDPMTDKQEPDSKKILAAFHDTKFALPMVHIQPEGNLTLVNLPTYFEVKWPAAGFQPGEIDTPTLLDRRVEIRPVARGYNYFFGDETGFGPTLSPGGIYPTGDITHVYTQALRLPDPNPGHLRRRVPRRRQGLETHPRHRPRYRTDRAADPPPPDRRPR